MTLRELAEALGAELIGGGEGEEVLGAAGLEDVGAGEVTYVEGERRLAEAEASPALAVIARPDLTPSRKPALRVENPRLAFARALALLYPQPRMSPGVHPSAQVGDGVVLGDGVAVGAYAVLGDGAQVGRNTQLHPLVSVRPGVVIGEECVIFSNVTLYERIRLGDRVVIQSGAVVGSAGFGYVWDGERHVWLPHVGRVIVEDDVDIGANTTIDRGTTGDTVIGAGTKIDNLVQVAHNVTVGKNCILAGQVGISGSVTLGDGVVLAGQVGVADHVHIGRGANAGAGSDIMRDVPEGTVVLGRPARPIDEQLRIDAAAARLPDLVREVRALRKKVSELEERLKDPSG
jgi:UDP-3-O-[3-hydroxymyristoyl] glucosamine N-acyltransferase